MFSLFVVMDYRACMRVEFVVYNKIKVYPFIIDKLLKVPDIQF